MSTGVNSLNPPITYLTLCKRCSRCEQDRPLTEFGRDARNRDGKQTRCKPCVNAYVKAWRDEHLEQVREQRQQRLPQLRERRREHYAKAMADPAKRAEYNEYMRAYRAANRSRVNEIGAEHYARVRANDPDQLERKRHNRRERERAAGPITLTEKRAIWDAYEGRCYICHRDAEQYDHVKPLAAGGTNEPDNIRPICSGCNARKGAAWPVDFDELRARIYIEYRREDEAGESI